MARFLQFYRFVFFVGNSTTLTTVNLTGIVESAMNGSYYHYLGSLTTPTCDESVTWNVMKTSLAVTQAQVRSLGKLCNDYLLIYCFSYAFQYFLQIKVFSH